MTYFLNLFSSETYEAFSRSPRDVSGFLLRHENLTGLGKVGDKFVSYMTKLFRRVGLSEMTGAFFKDETPIFYRSMTRSSSDSASSSCLTVEGEGAPDRRGTSR